MIAADEIMPEGCLRKVTAVYDTLAEHSRLMLINCGGDSADIAGEICGGSGFVFLCTEPVSWEVDYTPWKADGLRKGEAFGGGADAYLKELTEMILPAAAEKFSVDINSSAVCGYSLGGLFSLYAALNSGIFRSAASVSGSLWYKGWTEYLSEKSENIRLAGCYVSLGDTEGKSKNQLLKTVDDKTSECCKILSAASDRFKFEYNSGGHFKDVAARMKKAVDFLSC